MTLNSILMKLKSLLSSGEQIKHSLDRIGKKKEFSFDILPENVDELRSLSNCKLTDPFATGAMTILALYEYQKDQAAGKAMLDYLKGPGSLSNYEMQFINDRFMDGKDYVVRTYFEGATVSNDYTPSKPYRITIIRYDDEEDGYLTVYARSGGADSPRLIKLRKKASTKEWFLLDFQGLLGDVRTPKSQDPWA